MGNARLDEAQVGIKTARRNINNLRYKEDTAFMAESEEELKSLLMKVKESEKAGLKLSIQKTKIMASSPTQFSCSVVSESLRTHELQNARLPVHHQHPESTQTHVH